MANLKSRKILTAILAVGGVIAGGIFLYKKYISVHECLDDDFEDFEDDFEDDDLDFEEEETSTPAKREYVPINLENGQKVADPDLKKDSEDIPEEIKEEEIV